LRMVDITEKGSIPRSAEATGRIMLMKKTIKAVRDETVEKGDPLTTAEIASIQAVKRTPDLVPMCHNIPIGAVNTMFDVGDDYIEARCCVFAVSKTGVEMEALVGVSIALLTIWDMVKYLEKNEAGQYPSTKISDIRVVEKRKG
jgi:cyclic pyranopterin monophosphate synthase